MTVYSLTFAVIICTFLLIGYNFFDLKRHDEGTALMAERAAVIRSGAQTFVKREYRVITVVVAVLAFGFTLTQEAYAGVCLLFGSILVTIAALIGLGGGHLR